MQAHLPAVPSLQFQFYSSAKLEESCNKKLQIWIRSGDLELQISKMLFPSQQPTGVGVWGHWPWGPILKGFGEGWGLSQGENEPDVAAHPGGVWLWLLPCPWLRLLHPHVAWCTISVVDPLHSAGDICAGGKWDLNAWR